MGCSINRKNVQIIRDTHLPDPLNLNNFLYWYQIFDFLDFKDLLVISPVCKIFHEHTGNTKILKKFQQFSYSENSITDCEPTKKDISIEIQNNSEIEPTPSFRSPVEGTKKHFLFSYESRRSSAHNPSDSLDNFLPSSTIRVIFGHDPIMEVNVSASAEFRKGILEPIPETPISETEFENFKSAIWQSLQNCDSSKLQKLLRNPLSATFIKEPSLDWVKNTEKISVLAGAVCTMCYVIVKIVLEYIPVDDLDRGITVETTENKTRLIKKFTPLQLACARGITSIVKSLLAKGCSAHISGVFHNRLGIKEIITDMGSPALAICVNSKLQKLHMGSSNFITKFEAEDRDYYECAVSLLEYSANPDINTMIPMYPTPLFLAFQNVKFVKLLLEYGANPNWTNAKGQSPLYLLAEKSNDLECIQTILEAGGLVDPPTCRPLFVAINSKNEKIVKYLKEKGAEVNGSNEVPSALQVAISGDDLNMCKLILDWPELQIDWCFRQNGKNMFHRIAMNQGVQVFDMITNGRSVEELSQIKQALNSSCFVDSQVGDTIPLFFALENLNLSQRFILLGSDVKRLNIAKCFLELNLEKPSLVFLVENKVDIMSKWTGKDVIWVANEKGRIDLMVFFVRNGANIDSENSIGQSVLHDACFKGFDAIVKILLQEGADPRKKCKRGLDAIEYANAYYPKKNAIVQEKIVRLIQSI